MKISNGAIDALIKIIQVSRVSLIDIYGTSITEKKELTLQIIGNKLINGIQTVSISGL